MRLKAVPMGDMLKESDEEVPTRSDRYGRAVDSPFDASKLLTVRSHEQAATERPQCGPKLTDREREG